MEDVLDLYAEPHNSLFPVVCFDERPCFLLADVLTPTPLRPGKPLRYDYEYEKKGSANLFGFLEPKTGRRHLQVTERRTKRDFALMMKHLLTVLYPTATKVRLVLDNLNTHTVAALYDTFPAEEARCLARRLEFHFTELGPTARALPVLAQARLLAERGRAGVRRARKAVFRPAYRFYRSVNDGSNCVV